MKFTKLATSDKFEYMMLSRLIQDAKYFIEHPDLKHLWAKTLDEHINKMLEQYTKLDPKPEWTSEDEIYELADKMKESYTNRWNEVHSDNKIEASDNFKVGDRVFYDPFYEFEDGEKGSFYDSGILREIKNWPSNNREYYMVELENGDVVEIGNIFHTEEEKDAFRNNWMNPKFEKESANDITFKVFYINDDMKKTEYKSFTDSKKAEQCAYKLFDKFKHQEPVWVERYRGNYDDGYTLLDLDPDTYDRKPIYKSYKSGYANGKKDYSVGKVFDIDDLESSWRYSKEWKEGYWQGVADAQEKEFYKQSAITQPNKPKPTTMLPDNMQWAWDPDAADWVAVLKDNDNTTPPLYDPNNQNVVNNTTTYMSNIKSSEEMSTEQVAQIMDEIAKEADYFDYQDWLVQDESDHIDQFMGDLNNNEKETLEKFFNEVNTDNEKMTELKNYYNKKYSRLVKSDYEDDKFDYTYYVNEFEKIIDSVIKQTNLPIKAGQSGNTVFIEISNKEISDEDKKQEFEQIINQILEQIRQYKPHFITFGINGDTMGIGITATEDNVGIGFYNEKPFKINSYNKKQSSCLVKFLDGPQYSKEIKIEAGLIKEGLVKYAGFDFNRGTKYTITTKGLKVLRKASEAEHNDALNEREKLAYLFGFNTDEVSTLDTTGKVIKSEEDFEYLDEPFYTSTKPSKKIDTLKELHDYIVSAEVVYFANKPKGISIKNTPEKMQKLKMLKEDIERAKEILNKYNYGEIKSYKKFSSKKWIICEADGTELGEVEADSELDAKVKFGIEHPEYADSQSICAKEIKSSTKFINELTEEGLDAYNFVTKLLGHKLDLDYHPLYGICDLVDIDDINIANKINDKFGASRNFIISYSGKWGDGNSYWIGFENKQDTKKEVDAQYEQTTESHEPYPNPSETPNDHIILENHDGWVNTASFEDDIRKQFRQPHQKLPNSDRDLELLEKEILDLIEGDKKEQVKSLFDEFQFSDKEAAQVTPEFAKLHELLGEYKKQDLITLTDLDGNLVASGDPQVINELEHKVKDIGYYCESVSEISDSDYAETYSLKIFMK